MPRVHALFVLLLFTSPAIAGVGDPQIATDHPWYPGELACSTFDRLFATQAEVYKRVTGRACVTDEDKVLAAWLWRNTHYWHGEEGAEDLWGQGFRKGLDTRGREYWTGLFAHGYGLCGTTHCQWVAEMEARLGHGRGRAVGANGHTAFEVFLKGGAYGDGRWVLLDHDLSTVVYDPAGKRLLGMKEISADWKQLTDRGFKPDRQHGWLICGLHPADNGSYAGFDAADYLAGYAGPPPVVHLRRGEVLRRYLQPGLEDGKTFVFWGRNYYTTGIPGPERSHTWVNQPDAMFGSKTGAGYKPGQARFANAVFSYTPDFTSGDYKEAVVSEDSGQVTFEFQTPYVIGTTPPNAKEWGIYDVGGKNGLVVSGKTGCKVSVSVDRGKTWVAGGKLTDTPDLTDAVKGHRQYWLKLHAGADQLAAGGLTITTVCQANGSVMPRLKDGGSVVRFEASGRAVVSAGPNVPQAAAHVVDGKFGSPSVTLELRTPRGEAVTQVFAAAHARSSSPPDPAVKYQIEMSTDGGKSWLPVVKDWTINRQGSEPADFWSQSFCWGNAAVERREPVSTVRVRFRNDGGKAYARAEVHLVYRVPMTDSTDVTFVWADDTGDHTATHRFTGAAGEQPWAIPTGKNVKTKWVEMKAGK
ncbi:MAG: hypothetical protein JWO38_3068 [Gemmataceae bacterium]|nr:hypothetical protein [Gemmataceae bacterium]